MSLASEMSRTYFRFRFVTESTSDCEGAVDGSTNPTARKNAYLRLKTVELELFRNLIPFQNQPFTKTII